LGEYYSGGSYVRTGQSGYPGGTKTTIPSTGAIKPSDFYKSGRLEEFIKIKKVENITDKNNWRDYYTDELAEKVYITFKKYFDLFGYDKNYYKK
jgi:hypothetical protein